MENTAIKRTILLTGGAGFIGSNALVYFFNKYPHYNFVVLDALTYAGDIKNIPQSIHTSPRFRFVYGDVRNPKLVDHIVSQVDSVIHFAAETHVARSIHDDTNFFETDVMGTQRVAYAVLRNKKTIDRFIHISTSEVYGTAMQEVMDESHPIMPQSPYAAAKAGADRLVYSYYTTYKIPSIIIRPFNIYGPHQHLEKAIPRFITSCILKEPITVHGTGESSRDYTYVHDLISAIDLVLHAPREKVIGEVFNVGSGESPKMKDIAEAVIGHMKSNNASSIHYSPFAILVGDRPGQVFRHTADATKIKNLLGWAPQMPFSEGLQKTIGWFVDNQDLWRHKVWLRHIPIETEEGKIELH